jgi:hypothetical protein
MLKVSGTWDFGPHKPYDSRSFFGIMKACFLFFLDVENEQILWPYLANSLHTISIGSSSNQLP